MIILLPVPKNYISVFQPKSNPVHLWNEIFQQNAYIEISF